MPVIPTALQRAARAATLLRRCNPSNARRQQRRTSTSRSYAERIDVFDTGDDLSDLLASARRPSVLTVARHLERHRTGVGLPEADRVLLLQTFADDHAAVVSPASEDPLWVPSGHTARGSVLSLYQPPRTLVYVLKTIQKTALVECCLLSCYVKLCNVRLAGIMARRLLAQLDAASTVQRAPREQLSGEKLRTARAEALISLLRLLAAGNVTRVLSRELNAPTVYSWDLAATIVKALQTPMPEPALHRALLRAYVAVVCTSGSADAVAKAQEMVEGCCPDLKRCPEYYGVLLTGLRHRTDEPSACFWAAIGYLDTMRREQADPELVHWAAPLRIAAQFGIVSVSGRCAELVAEAKARLGGEDGVLLDALHLQYLVVCAEAAGPGSDFVPQAAACRSRLETAQNLALPGVAVACIRHIAANAGPTAAVAAQEEAEAVAAPFLVAGHRRRGSDHSVLLALMRVLAVTGDARRGEDLRDQYFELEMTLQQQAEFTRSLAAVYAAARQRALNGLPPTHEVRARVRAGEAEAACVGEPWVPPPRPIDLVRERGQDGAGGDSDTRSR
eukprot:TRINITY_DN466_c1_g1_i1.p1 TRINITY_DN466_c1_g1~~TRINITY_DN466_c1_g1_i1.p1  ORF type:complete len:561 (+),score=165.19 TRINITY_DN466_c1_g1_i1:62-1744(+)